MPSPVVAFFSSAFFFCFLFFFVVAVVAVVGVAVPPFRIDCHSFDFVSDSSIFLIDFCFCFRSIFADGNTSFTDSFFYRVLPSLVVDKED